MEVDLTKYNTAARICGDVYNMLKTSILQNDIVDIKTLYNMGMDEITKRCDNIFKSIDRKGVAFPISINLNNCIDNFTYSDLDSTNVSDLVSTNVSIIKLNDIVKIKLGVDIDGCIAMYCDTFIYNKENECNTTIDFLHNMKKEIVKQVFPGNTNDELKIFIESKCTDNDCFPLINCKSFEHLDNQIYNTNGKYVILNYKKLYDKNDYLIHENTCFEFLENEVYTINLAVVPDDGSDNFISENDNGVRIDLDNTRLHRFNDYFYSFKLNASKQLYSKVFSEHYNNVFDISKYTSDKKLKMGVNECKKMNILETLPVTYTKNKLPVYSCAFTLVVNKDKSLMLKYH
jgi:methionine aminopeptidase